MIIDGNKIANSILKSLAEEIALNKLTPHLVIISCDSHKATNAYIQHKTAKAEDLGIKVTSIQWSNNISQSQAKRALQEVVSNNPAAGIVLQLPIPTTLDLSQLTKLIPEQQDVDGLRYLNPEIDSQYIPAVIAAILEIINLKKIELADKNIVINGSEGTLVGQPLSRYLRSKNISFAGIDINTPDSSELLLAADVIISGVGKKHLIEKNDVQTGAIIIDAGFCVENGKIYGDINPNVADKAKLYTPVPGGIGPITITVLLRNVVKLAKLSQK
ncbi:tetrahydrofolate dehydrogenase/cyclohydrolase catalytic domain-containing protein [Patescibacteria group bacterium]